MTGKLIGNVIGTTIALKVADEYILKPLTKKRKKKKKGDYDDIFKL